MSEDRKKPGIVFWATMGLVVVLVGYPLSAGPALWVAHHDIPQWLLNAICYVYGPLNWAETDGPELIRRAVSGYLALWIPSK
jgi:hypothetical protein